MSHHGTRANYSPSGTEQAPFTILLLQDELTRLRAALQASEARVRELEEAQGVGEAEYLAMRHRAHDAERRLEAKTALLGDAANLGVLPHRTLPRRGISESVCDYAVRLLYALDERTREREAANARADAP